MRSSIRGAGRTSSLSAAVLAVGVLVAACSSGSAAAPAGQPGAESRNAAGGAPAAPSAGPATNPGKANGSNAYGDATAFNDGAKILRTGSLQLEVKDVPAALKSARSAIQGLGGYIGASQQSTDGDTTVASITYRIPADRWEDALDALRGLGHETGEQTDAADVTGQLVDLDARIRNLKASETALVKHLGDTGKVSDVLEIESRLSDVRGQIEQLSAQKANLDNQVAYASLTVTFAVTIEAVKQVSDSWDPAGEVDRAGASLVGFLQTAANAGIWFAIVWLPILAVLGVLVAVALFVLRRFGFVRRVAPPSPPAPPAPAEA